MSITDREKITLESIETDLASTDTVNVKSSLPDKTVVMSESNVIDQIPKTILIAEDDDFNFLLVESLLIRNGYNIHRAGNGAEAVHLHIKNPEICLILMDLQMPEMDGFAATKKIRETDNGIPIIAQTAFVVPGVKEKAFSSGCDAFLTKPIDPEDLLTQINCLLNNSQKMIVE